MQKAKHQQSLLKHRIINPLIALAKLMKMKQVRLPQESSGNLTDGLATQCFGLRTDKFGDNLEMAS
jgi:hypothetical protein